MKREKVKMEGEVEPALVSPFISAVIVRKGEVGLNKGKRCLATKTTSHRTSRPLAS